MTGFGCSGRSRGDDLYAENGQVLGRTLKDKVRR